MASDLRWCSQVRQPISLSPQVASSIGANNTNVSFCAKVQMKFSMLALDIALVMLYKLCLALESFSMSEHLRFGLGIFLIEQ